MKICSKCNQEKPLESYSRCKNVKDGHHNVCKACWKDYAKRKPESPKLKLARRLPPDIDQVLHNCSVRAADELATMNDGPTSGRDIIKMKALIDILLVIRKNARPKKPKEEKVEKDEELFD